jgi:nucleotide-binding universal stress UspA family protein
MKTILIPIDFSKPSENAARYALQLGKHIKANIMLCNAIYIPQEVPTEPFGPWGGYDLGELKDESMLALEAVASKMRNKLNAFSMPSDFQPEITCVNDTGEVMHVITEVAKEQNATLLVMGMTGAGSFSRLIFGSISLSMIDNTQVPLVLVPEECSFGKMEKICFATTLVDNDIEVIRSLAHFARFFNAELIVAHISANNDEIHRRKFESFLNAVSSQVHYNKLIFRNIDKANVDKGLDSLTENSQLDLLVMVHGQKGLFNSLLSSHTHIRANRLNVPMMVIPDKLHVPCF